MYCVEMPINFGTVVEGPVSQQSKTVAGNLVRLRHNVLRLARQMLSNKANAFWDFICRKEKAPRRPGRTCYSIPARVQPQPEQGDVDPLGDFLAHTSLEFVPTHVAQAGPESSSGESHNQSLSSSSRYTPIGVEEVVEN